MALGQRFVPAALAALALGAAPACGLPVVSTATYLGGSGADRAYAVAVDLAGNVYVAGETDSADFPETGRLDPVGPSTDAFVVKLDPTGSHVLWATIFGGSFADSARAIAVDAAGEVYVAGQTFSPDFPAGPGRRLPAPIAHGTGFLLKLDADGRHVAFARFVGADLDASLATGVAADAAGRAYVVGRAGEGAAETPIYVAFDPDGAPLAWGPGAGPLCPRESGPDVPVAVAADSTGRAIVAGRTAGRHLFVARLGPGQKPLYVACLGGRGVDLPASIATDAADDAFVAGVTSSRDFPLVHPLQKTLGGATDAFVVKLGPRGRPVYSTFLGGAGDDEALGIAVDADGRAAVTGATTSPAFPRARAAAGGCAPGGAAAALDAGHAGGAGDAGDEGCRFVASLAGDGSAVLYSLYVGDAGTRLAAGALLAGAATAGPAIAAQRGGGVLVVGTTPSSALVPVRAAQPELGGGASDAYLVKIDRTSPVCWPARAAPSVLWPPDGRLVPVRILYVADSGGGPVVLGITAVTQDERPGSEPTAAAVGNGTVALQAARDAFGDGRVYHLAFTATGPEGASCSGEVTVCVPRDLGPDRACGDEGPLYPAGVTGPR